MQWASYNITSNSRGIAKLGKPWTQATAATLAPRVLQELRAMAAVADKDESTKEAISPEAWWVNCAPQEEQIWQTIYTSMGIWGFGIVGLHDSFSGICIHVSSWRCSSLMILNAGNWGTILDFVRSF